MQVSGLVRRALRDVSHADFEQFLEESPAIGRVVYRNLLVLLIDRLRANISDLDVFRPIG